MSKLHYRPITSGISRLSWADSSLALIELLDTNLFLEHQN